MSCFGQTVRWIAVAVCVSALGCGDDEDGGGGSTAGCEAGFERGEDGSCVPNTSECGPSELLSPRSGQCLAAGWGACPEGFDANPDGTSCEPVLSTSCGSGTRPELGTGLCAPVGFTDCPDGFSPGPWGCEDVLPPAPCTGATRDAIGSETCQPVGDCAAAFPPPEATWFVDDSFTAGELDATHFLTIGEALAAAGAGDTIAVESGTYSETLVIDEAVSLAGRCPAEVLLQGAGAAPGVEVDGASGVQLSGMTIRGHLIGVIARGGGSLELTTSILEDNDNVGALSTEASELIMRDSVIRGTQPINGTQFGYAVDINSGGSVELEGTSLVDNHRVAVGIAGSGTSLSMRDSVIRATRTDVNGDFGVAIVMQQGASVLISESVIAENYESDIVALGAGTNLTVERSVFRDTETNVTGYGRGIDIETGARAILTDVTLLRHHEVSVLSTQATTEVTLERVTIDDTRVDAKGEHGTAVLAQEGGRVVVTDSALVRSGDQAVFVDDQGTEVILERSVAASSGAADGTFGRGLSLFGGARITLSDSAVLDNREAAALVTDAGTDLTVTRSLIARTTGDAAGAFGRGISVQAGAQLSMSSSVLEQNQESGLIAIGAGTLATVDSTVIRGTEARVSDGAFGRGIMVQGGARAVIQSSAVVDNTEVGIFASGAGSGLELRDALVTGTRTSPLGKSGIAIAVQSGAGALLERVAVTDHRVAGLVANGEGTTVVVNASFLRGTQPGLGEEMGFAHGAVALMGATLSLSDVELSDHVGIGVAFAAASGVLDACRFERNGVGLHTQDGTQLLEVGAVGSGAPLQVQVTDTVSFTGNGTRFGAESLPMPGVVPDLE